MVLQLHRRFWDRTPEQLEQALRRQLAGVVDVFVPAAAQLAERGSCVTRWLVPGYVFVRTLHLQASVPRFVTKPSVVPAAEVERLRGELERMRARVGDRVLVTAGAYRGLEGALLELDGDLVRVDVVLRSRRDLVKLPRDAVRVLERDGVVVEHPWVDGDEDGYRAVLDGRQVLVDPVRLALRPGEDEPHEESSELPTFSAEDYQALVVPLLDTLPPIEADFVELYYGRQISQAQLGTIWGMARRTVGERLERATARLRFLLTLPPIREEQLRSDLRALFGDEQDVDLFLGLLRTTSYTEVSRHLGISPSSVCGRFGRRLARLQRLSTYHELFAKIQANMEILQQRRYQPGHGPAIAKAAAERRARAANDDSGQAA